MSSDTENLGRELPEPGVYLDDVGEWQSGERDEDVG